MSPAQPRPAPPLLSAWDAPEQAEGGVDPLGTAPAYESLAERILPCLTVRMARPRFLTAMALGALVCETRGDAPGADGITPPWLVFEWHVVEAFVRTERITKGQRIPGVQKVEHAHRRGQSISRHTYLKTPAIFGFHGIYRRLAHGLQVLGQDGALDEGGYELLQAWEHDQQLAGLISGAGGAGTDLRDRLVKAVESGLKAGHTSCGRSWRGWEDLAAHLEPRRIGQRERRVLSRLLLGEPRTIGLDPEAPAMRREFLKALADHGQPVTERQAEASYFRHLMPLASPSLRHRLEAIDAWEAVCRTITDGFELILYKATLAGASGVTARDYADDRLARRLVRRLPAAVRRVQDVLDGAAWAPDVKTHVERFGEVRTATELFDAIIAHHEDVQRLKLPDGKRAFLERLRDAVVVRTRYRRETPVEETDSYVHWYRTGTASSLLRDLRRFGR